VARTRIPARVALALAAAAAALVVIVVAGGRSGSDTEAPPAESVPVATDAELTPRIALFGDTLTATVDVVVDRTVVDPGRVAVAWSHAPWAQVGAPQHARRDSGTATHLRTTFVLRCLTSQCVPARETEEVEFDPARVTYAAPVGAGSSRLTVDVPWPTLVVHTRIGASDGDQRDALAAPWRADTVSLPVVSYRASPGLVLASLLAAGVLFLAAAALLAYRALPERVPPPEPEPPPRPVVSPLEQALAVLETPAGTNGAQDRRRALELVAEEVERWGDDDGLAHAARTLAWSEDEPGDETRAFAARLRSRMERMNGVPA
jgi:hypothetical protein